MKVVGLVVSRASYVKHVISLMKAVMVADDVNIGQTDHGGRHNLRNDLTPVRAERHTYQSFTCSNKSFGSFRYWYRLVSPAGICKVPLWSRHRLEAISTPMHITAAFCLVTRRTGYRSIWKQVISSGAFAVYYVDICSNFIFTSTCSPLTKLCNHHDHAAPVRRP